MTDIRCDTCERMLKEEELPENRSNSPVPFLPEPREKECFICYVERADLDGPNNNFLPNHEKDNDSHLETLAFFKRLRDN